MKLKHLLVAFSFLVLPLTLADSASAQAVPLPGTGCPGSLGPIVPGGRPPSSSNPWNLQCQPNPNWNCVSGPVILLGVCSPAIPLGGLGCVAGCSLVINPSFGTFPDPLFVGPGGLQPGFTFCAQCACIDAAGCIQISEALQITMTP
ncbi:MAG: hypothetical protein KDB80_06100 [Planctomycetes bacterium]|nr:hypothetical protein [Planctomycetota bacterium]